MNSEDIAVILLVTIFFTLVHILMSYIKVVNSRLNKKQEMTKIDKKQGKITRKIQI